MSGAVGIERRDMEYHHALMLQKNGSEEHLDVGPAEGILAVARIHRVDVAVWIPISCRFRDSAEGRW